MSKFNPFIEGAPSTEMAPASNKRKHDEVDDNNTEEKVTPYDVLESQLEKVKPLLCPPNDKAFSTQMNYLNTYFGTIEKGMLSATLTWEAIARTMSYFLSYHMIRKIYGEDAEGLRSAARAMYNLVYQLSPLIKSNNDDERDRLIEYTRELASYPYEVIYDLQSLWDTFYWEKKEDVYPYLKKSKFELQPGDSFTKPSADGTEDLVVVKESDMILTKGDINKMSPVTMYLALARATRVLFRNRGFGASTRQFKVGGEYTRIYIGPKHRCKEEGAELLEEYRVTSRKYEKLLVDEFGGRIQIERVEKDGWWMRTESWGETNSVFVPLTAKVAKMGIVGTVFSGMRLGLAGGLWRPLPSGQQVQPTICYNVYPPSFDDFETESEKKNARNEKTESNGKTEEGKKSEEDGTKRDIVDLTVDGVEEEEDVVLPTLTESVDEDGSTPILKSDVVVGASIAESKEDPSDAEFHALIDILFASATKDTCTIGEMNRSIATYYGWEEVDKERKKKIKKRLLDLVNGQCEQVRLSDLVSGHGAGNNDESNTK